MKTIIMLSYLCVMAFSVPLPKKVYKIQENIPSLIDVEVEASNPVDVIRKVRQLINVDIDIHTNNGYGYFDNGKGVGGNVRGYERYGRYGGYGPYGGYGDYGGHRRYTTVTLDKY